MVESRAGAELPILEGFLTSVTEVSDLGTALASRVQGCGRIRTVRTNGKQENSVPETLLKRPTYSAPEVGQFVGVAPARVRRWLRGYRYVRLEGVRHQAALVSRDSAPKSPCASFLELVDLLFVKRFLDTGISLRTLRRALGEATEILGVTHFAGQRFFTDGHKVYLEIREKGDALLQLISGGQWTIAPVIRTLAERIDFDDATGLACRWYPRGKAGRVVLDPAMSFGRPTLVDHSVATSNIFDFYQAEGESIEATCDWWGLSPGEVEAAIAFEDSVAA